MVFRHLARIKMKKEPILIALALVGIGIAGRLMPHYPNATPITTLALAGKRYLGRRWSLTLPIVAMLASDFIIGFYNWRVMASVYGSFFLVGLLSWCLKKNSGPIAFGIVALVSSLLFFLVTNFAVWLLYPWYAKSFAGLIYCYTLGIPFLRNMIIGDLLYTSALLGAGKLIGYTRLYMFKQHPRIAVL